jgi:glycosyltransferase involved in cell wall biosynthesis
MIFNVLLDLGKLKNPYSGLGQFSFNFGKHILNKKDASLCWNFLVPESAIGTFQKDVIYEKISLKRRLFPSFCQKYHLWHALHQDSSYYPADRKSPFILTIHDLNFLKEKKSLEIEKRLKNLQKKVDRASVVTFVSNYTASVSKEYLNLEGKDLSVVHNGVDIDTKKIVKKPLFLPEGQFLFALGWVLKKKNFHVLIDFIRELPEYNLIIAGDNSAAYAKMIRKKVLQNNLQTRVIIPGVISEDEKIYLYKHCKAFLFPSKIEGFGLPVIEAMRFGKPVFISQHASLPEIGGQLAYYWDSFSPDDMVSLFRSKISRYESEQDTLSGKIIAYSNQFNWESSIEKYYNLYVSTINKHYDSKIGSSP